MRTSALKTGSETEVNPPNFFFGWFGCWGFGFKELITCRNGHPWLWIMEDLEELLLLPRHPHHYLTNKKQLKGGKAEKVVLSLMSSFTLWPNLILSPLYKLNSFGEKGLVHKGIMGDLLQAPSKKLSRNIIRVISKQTPVINISNSSQTFLSEKVQSPTTAFCIESISYLYRIGKQNLRPSAFTTLTWKRSGIFK